jgi:hypothetical protein
MAQGHILLICLALISDHLPSLFLALSIPSLVFLWCNRTNHSTPHPDAVHDMYSVLKNPTASTSTTVATTYITPSAIPHADAAPIPPRNEELSQAWLCQPYDAFLVLDVEATCLQGTGFHWPNEIIVRYRIQSRTSRSIEYRNGQYVSSNGQTGGTMEWSVPSRKSQNFAALLNRLGAPSCPPFVLPSLA